MRLDQALVERGLAPSRTLAARLCREGCVSVNGKTASRPAFAVAAEDVIAVGESPLTRYVSRGGLKLEGALDAFGVSPAGLCCADLGASTGGFTDCLLQRGAARVWAVDSGRDQLHPSLRADGRVVSLEQVNARDLTADDLPPMDLVVMDVSFISQALLYPAVARILKPEGAFVSLIKPQFEVGRGEVGRGGIVKNEKARLRAVETLREKARAHGLCMEKVVPSPLTGGDGNVEYLALFHRVKEENR